VAEGLFLGVDGGQTATTAVIGDGSGRVLGRGSGGPCSYVRAFPPSRIASYAGLVEKAARGDEVACRILRHAAECLFELTMPVRRNLFNEDEQGAVSPVGGTFRLRLLAEHFRHAIGSQDGMHFLPATHGPGVGALIQAYCSAGLDIPLTNPPDLEK
jgi:N-acetylglucosamine kinase-like BadF-type ATPase